MITALDVAKEWLKVTDVTDGHLAADILADAYIALHAEVERMRPVYDAAMTWQRAGTNPCGLPECGLCTECVLWDVTSRATL